MIDNESKLVPMYGSLDQLDATQSNGHRLVLELCFSSVADVLILRVE